MMRNLYSVVTVILDDKFLKVVSYTDATILVLPSSFSLYIIPGNLTVCMAYCMNGGCNVDIDIVVTLVVKWETSD